jgi:hypothetical protein
MSPTSQPRIRSAAELRKVLDDFFAAVDADAEVGPRLHAGAAPLRLEFRDPDVVVTVTPAEGRACLAWDFEPDSDVKPKLLLSMEAEFGNRLLQGRENPAIAIVRGRLRTRVEDAAAALRFFGSAGPLFARYREVVAERYPHLAVD